jgi:cobalt-zinc-cadmium resistance protein CzcA
VVPLAAIVVFGLLYVALESLPSALAILTVTPFAMTGGVFALAVTGIPLSVSAAVGFIALLGQACLASLLVVSGVDQRRRDGAELGPALAAGAVDRFRVVLMTAMLAILGLLPAAMSSGVGSETQKPFSIVIIGGLLTAVPVTLLVLPVVYSVVVRRLPALSSDADMHWELGEAES